MKEQLSSIRALQGDGRMPNFITSMKCSKLINVTNCKSSKGEMGRSIGKSIQAFKSDVCAVQYGQMIACEGRQAVIHHSTSN